MELNNIFNRKKITKNRSTKKEFFAKEQQDILDKINIILHINNKNNIIYLYDIENDLEKKNQIFALAQDIKKYFKSGEWGFFKKEVYKNNHFLLCKSIYKEFNYDIINKPIDIIRNNKKIRTTKYIIGKFNIII